MKKFIISLLEATGVRCLLIRYHQSRLRAAEGLMRRFGTDTHMPVWCSKRFTRHQRALLLLGFLARKEFTLTQRFIRGRETYLAFSRLMRARFPEGSWSCAISVYRLIVTAPVSQLPAWENFLNEYDRQVI